MNAIKWQGQRTCDFCGKEGLKTLIDGKTIYGPWGVMCDVCFRIKGVGLGTGRGQRYVDDGKGSLIKIAG